MALLTSGMAAEMAGVTSRTIRRWAEAGVLSAVTTPGGRLRVKVEDLEAVLRPVATLAEKGEQD